MPCSSPLRRWEPLPPCPSHFQQQLKLSRGPHEAHRSGNSLRIADQTRCAPHLWLPRRDRKSTRLNSSHQIISYAVFCLKKKNEAIDTISWYVRHCTNRIRARENW